jgi:rhomboid protease GluP
MLSVRGFLSSHTNKLILANILMFIFIVATYNLLPVDFGQRLYKVGDYFVYKIETNVTGTVTAAGNVTSIACSWKANMRVEITKIDLPYVYAKGIYRNVKISGECPPEIVFPPPKEGESTGEMINRIDEKPSAEFKLFVDPSYSGTFQTSAFTPYEPYGGTSTSISYKYNKGVLISRTMEINRSRYIPTFSEVVKATVKHNLIETSMPGLIFQPVYYATSPLDIITGRRISDLQFLLSQVNYYVVSKGFIWQLLTSMFIHIGIIHLTFNMIALYIFGNLVENGYGKRNFLLIYFISGFSGNIATLFLLKYLQPMGDFIPSAGASGAIFGLIGAYAMLGRLSGSFAAGLSYAIIIFLFSSLFPGVNIIAHLFGLLGGLVVAFFLTRKLRKHEEIIYTIDYY